MPEPLSPAALEARVLSLLDCMGQLTLQSLEYARCGVSRRTLQRLLRNLVDRKILIRSGATNRVVYTRETEGKKPCPRL